MSLLTRNLRQTATLWVFNGVSNSGDPSFVAPVQVTVRWEDRVIEFIDNRGEKTVSKSVVYLSQDVNQGDFMVLGTDSTASPINVVGAFEVRDFRKIPAINGTDMERRALLGSRGG